MRGSRSRRALVLTGVVALGCVAVAVGVAAFHKSGSDVATTTAATGIEAYQACLTQHGVTEDVPAGQAPSAAQIKAFADCRPALGLDQSGGNARGISSTRLQYYECIYKAGMKAQSDGKSSSGDEFDSNVEGAVERCRDAFGFRGGSGPQESTTTTPTY